VAEGIGDPESVRSTPSVDSRLEGAMPNTSFSRHAYQRVDERLTMEPSDLADLLNWDLAVRIGAEEGTNRVHRLFYSHDDHQCFVAVQDELTGTVVTILPVDYYEQLAWRISEDVQEEARVKVSRRAAPSATGATRVPPDEPNSSGRFRITGTFRDLHNRPKVASLGTWPSAPYDRSILSLLQDEQFFREMKSRFTQRRGPDIRLLGVSIQTGPRNLRSVWVGVE
jgi:hypothetical protein